MALDLPPLIAELVDVLAAMPGTVAVVLGGSRALASSDAGSDWDLGLYYRGMIDLTTLAARGVVYPPGSWGRLMNGGAWLRCGGEKVDVLLRDLDVVEHGLVAPNKASLRWTPCSGISLGFQRTSSARN